MFHDRKKPSGGGVHNVHSSMKDLILLFQTIHRWLHTPLLDVHRHEKANPDHMLVDRLSQFPCGHHDDGVLMASQACSF
jgi:hypothetical protein